MRGIISFVAAAALSGMLGPAALAESELERQIKSTALDIYDAVDRSGASTRALAEALGLLQQALEIIEDGAGRNELFCEPASSNSSYVTRVADGVRLSSTDVRNDVCRQIIENTRNGLVCAPASSSYAYVTDIESGRVLGTDVRLQTCFDLVNSSTPQLACAPASSSYAYVYRIDGAQRLGTSDVRFDLCKEILANSTRSFVCAPSSSSSAYITRIATGETIGADLRYADCYARIRTLP